jgi:hypothetical protein
VTGSPRPAWRDIPAMVMMFASHDAFRRDLRDFARLGARPGAIPDAAATAWQDFRLLLGQHHQAEDDYLWPTARTRLPGDAGRGARLQLMQQEHAALDPLLERGDAAFAGGDRRHLAPVVGPLRDSLEKHLRDEETLVLPWLAPLLTTADWASYQRQSRQAAPTPRLPLVFLPWVSYQRADPPGSGTDAVFPAALRLVIRRLLLPRYARRQGWRREGGEGTAGQLPGPATAT